MQCIVFKAQSDSQAEDKKDLPVSAVGNESVVDKQAFKIQRNSTANWRMHIKLGMDNFRDIWS